MAAGKTMALGGVPMGRATATDEITGAIQAYANGFTKKKNRHNTSAVIKLCQFITVSSK